MIIGVGIDVTPIERMALALERQGEAFEARLFTPDERRYCRGHSQFSERFAARFAAKEALLKALGVPQGLSWHEIEVISAEGARPQLRLAGEAAAAASRAGVVRVHLSMSHAGGQATAMVIAEGLDT